MKNFFVLAAFLFSATIGSLAFNLFQPKIEKEQNFNRKNFCELKNFEEEFFTLDEANEVFGKKVISTDRDFNFGKRGRIVSFEMISPNKFLIEIYWGNGAEDENSTVTFHDKKSFSKNFEIVN